MKVKGINGRDYTISLLKYMVHNDSGFGKSQYHNRARTLLEDTFKSYMVLEEVKIPGTGRLALYIDFLIPNLNIAVEVHGRQHYEYVPFFHKTKAGFVDSMRRDALKREWCELNDIELVELKYSEPEKWRDQIEQR